MKRPFPLAYKILIALAIILLPIFIIFVISLHSIRDNTEKLVFQDMNRVAQAKANEVLLFFELLRNRIQDFSTDKAIREEAGRSVAAGSMSANARLSEYLRKYKLPVLADCNRISVTALDGTVIASTDRSELGLNVSGEKFFKSALREPSLGVRIFGFMGKPELAVAAPVYNAMDGQRIIAVISGFVPLEKIGARLKGDQALKYAAGTVQEEDAIDMHLASREGVIITETRSEGSKVEVKKNIEKPPVLACFGENRNFKGYFKGFRGEEVGSSVCMPSIGWVLVVEMMRSEAFAPVAQMELYAALTVLITMALISALVFYFYRTVIRQIVTLSAASRQVAAGDYDISLPVRSEDELGALTDSFNRMARGISERSRALYESEERFRAIVDNTSTVIYVKDLDGRHIFINRKFEELFHITGDEAKEKTAHNLFPKESAERIYSNDLKALASDHPLEFEEAAELDDGTHTYISVKVALKGTDGRPYALAGISTDITDIKRSQEALKRSEASLANAQRIAHIGNWDWYIVKGELHWSDEIYRIFGVPPQEFGATYEAFLCYVHPDDLEFVKESVREALSGVRPYSIDHRIILKDGSERTVHEQAEVTFEDGKAVRMSGTVQDITERKRAEEEIRKLNVELEARVAARTAELADANRELESFSYTVAHDLKNPLRVIGGFSGLLLKGHAGGLDPAGVDYLKRLKSESLRMEQIIDALLGLSQVMRAQINREDLDLTELFRSVADGLMAASPDRKAEFISDKGLTGRGDPGLIRVVFENLIGNAWKFTQKRDTARIEFGRKVLEDGRAVFFIKDNGTGFDMKYAERLFAPFERLHGQEFAGTGIGLATVQRVIRQHGGIIWAEAEEGAGAIFYFTF